ncbi:DUF3592 domain-containing protein [Microbacterium sp. 179-I 3D4 NHS]|uniref:DUF3592 domain-containing protein n=1 Tax=Microbacterium sp. 179-I 3D4 NHS TaxID=3142381 RepID=UPI0039A2EEA4
MTAARARERRRPKDGERRRWASFGPIIFGAMWLLVAAVYLAFNVADARAMSSTTSARVTEVDDRTGARSPCYVDYRFEVEGRAYQARTDVRSRCRHLEADTWTTVYYDAHDPERSTLRDPQAWSELYGQPVLLTLGGLLFIGLGVGPAREKRRRMRQGALRADARSDAADL